MTTPADIITAIRELETQHRPLVSGFDEPAKLMAYPSSENPWSFTSWLGNDHYTASGATPEEAAANLCKKLPNAAKLRAEAAALMAKADAMEAAKL